MRWIHYDRSLATLSHTITSMKESFGYNSNLSTIFPCKRITIPLLSDVVRLVVLAVCVIIRRCSIDTTMATIRASSTVISKLSFDSIYCSKNTHRKRRQQSQLYYGSFKRRTVSINVITAHTTPPSTMTMKIIVVPLDTMQMEKPAPCLKSDNVQYVVYKWSISYP